MLRISRVLAGAGVLALVACASAQAKPAAPAWTPYDRPATQQVVTEKDVPITMRDGVVLRANVQHPAATGRWPTLIVQTPYNKDGAVNVALGGQAEYFVARGFTVVTVDVRGTGGSQGSWDSFGPAEQRDGYEIVEWAARQSWSTGKVGLFGPSYMGLIQLLTAAQRPPHLKAIFPIVPMADGYRDITFSGGQLNVSFIPLWLGLVTGGAFTPPPYALSGSPTDLEQGLTALASHAQGLNDFQAHTILDSATGGTTAYDGPFWKTRSPLELVDRIRVPAFVVGGHHDLFQRGEPLVYERLRRRVPAWLLMGPWTHVEGSMGAGLPRDGVPAMNSIALRFFDHYLSGKATDVGAMPRVTQYVYGRDRYEIQPDWPDRRLTPARLHLRGGGRLDAGAPGAGEAPQQFAQNPVSGVCTQSTVQWTAGLGQGIPCTQDNRTNESLGDAVYTTAPLAKDLELSGPVLANLWVSTTARDAVVATRLTDVAPDGTSSELTTGWLAASFRAVDRSRSRIVRGQLLQPWHPFTQASVETVEPGKPMEMPVEIFPVRAVIRVGHRLRLTVDPGDFPHQLPPAPQALSSLAGQVSVLTDPQHPSYLEIPGLGACAKTVRGLGRRKVTRGACSRVLPVPRLIRG